MTCSAPFFAIVFTNSCRELIDVVMPCCRLYVGSTVNMFDQLRADWQYSSISLTQSVVENLASSELVSSSVSSKSFQTFQKKLYGLDTKLSSNQSSRMEKLISELDYKAQVKIIQSYF